MGRMKFFNRQLLLRLHRHVENARLLNALAWSARARASMRAGMSSHSVHGAPDYTFVLATDLSKKELCIRFVKSRRLCDLVFPAVIWAFSVSRLIAECQSRKRRAPAREATHHNTGHRSKLKRCCERENDRAGASYLWGITLPSAPFEALCIGFNAMRQLW